MQSIHARLGNPWIIAYHSPCAAPPSPRRVCIVNSAGNVLLDRYVRPKEKVTDFRTKVSGEARHQLKL